MHVARHVLEPFGGVARRGLNAQHLGLALCLIGGKRGRHVGSVRVERACQRDRILQREFGAGADGEMRGMGGIAHQHDIAH